VSEDLQLMQTSDQGVQFINLLRWCTTFLLTCCISKSFEGLWSEQMDSFSSGCLSQIGEVGSDSFSDYRDNHSFSTDDGIFDFEGPVSID